MFPVIDPAPVPGITSAILTRSARTAQAAAGEAGQATIIPQFLAGVDIESYHGDTLGWSLEGWEGGDRAEGPAPASSFDALDAILVGLADRHVFPDLGALITPPRWSRLYACAK